MDDLAPSGWMATVTLCCPCSELSVVRASSVKAPF